MDSPSSKRHRLGFRAARCFYQYGVLVTSHHSAHDVRAASSRNPYDGRMYENYYNNVFPGVSFNGALGCTALRSSGYAQVRHHQHSHGLEAHPRGVRSARKALRRAWQRGRNHNLVAFETTQSPNHPITESLNHRISASQTRRMLSPPGASGFTHSNLISASGVR